jgi:hypothetical protein
MTRYEKFAVDIIRDEIKKQDEAAFNALVEARTVEGWADPVTQAGNEWQGHDNGVVFGAWSEAFEAILEFGTVPAGCRGLDPDEQYGTSEKREHLWNALTNAGTAGTGKPLAYVGVEGYFTLIRETAEESDIRSLVADCFPSV